MSPPIRSRAPRTRYIEFRVPLYAPLIILKNKPATHASSQSSPGPPWSLASWRSNAEATWSGVSATPSWISRSLM